LGAQGHGAPWWAQGGPGAWASRTHGPQGPGAPWGTWGTPVGPWGAPLVKMKFVCLYALSHGTGPKAVSLDYEVFRPIFHLSQNTFFRKALNSIFLTI